MKRENKKLLAWVLSFVMLFGCFAKTDMVKAAEGDATIENERVNNGDTWTTYEDLSANESYVVTADGKNVDVSADDIAYLAQVFDTGNVYERWTDPKEIIKTFGNGTVVSAIADEGNKRTVVVEEKDTQQKSYAVEMNKLEDGNLEFTVWKEGTKTGDIVKVTASTVSINRGSTVIVKVTKGTDGKYYNVDVDKEWAEKNSFVLKKADQEEPSTEPPATATATSTATATATSTITPTPTVTPTEESTPIPTETTEPTTEPTVEPTTEPTTTPTTEPTSTPTITPTEEPTITPTITPTVTPESNEKIYKKEIGQSINVKKEFGKKCKITGWKKHASYITVNSKKGTIRIEKYKKQTMKINISVGKKKWILGIKVKRPKLKITIKNRRTISAKFSNVGKAQRVILQFKRPKKKKYVSPPFYKKYFKKKGGKFRNPTKLPKLSYRLCVIYGKKKSYSKSHTV